ncbi:MAG: Ig-like domain-containing protein [Gaiellaceae bacterium]
MIQTLRSPRRRATAVIAFLAAILAVLASASAAGADQWYKTDTHVHSVTSGDATDDVGIIANAARAAGYDALFLTDHTATGNAAIGGVVANHVVLDESADLGQFSIRPYGSYTGTAVNAVTSPVNTGTSAFEITSTAGGAGYGEEMLWYKRGPNLRSGDIILKFSVYPTRIDAGSGLYASMSLGGDPTITSRPPQGYTTTDGVTHPGKHTVFVWQLGNARTAQSNPDDRVLTHSLPYTLNQWNTYTINVSQAIRDEMPAADIPLDYNAITQLKLAAGGTTGTADGVFDSYHLDATSPPTSAQDFVDRNHYVHNWDTSTFKIFAAQEVGYSRHAQRFNFDISDPAQFTVYKQGIQSILPTQQTGYPAQLNHPGLPGGVTQQEAIDTQGEGADAMEVAERSDEEGYIKNVMVDAWDGVLKQGVQLLGAWSSDMHRVERLGPATYLYSPALDFDKLMQTYYEGRSYLALNDFGGRAIFNVDGSSEPYPARYPVFVSSTDQLANARFQITGGIQPGSRVVWTRNGDPWASDATNGPSYDVTKSIPLGGSWTYIRAELRNSANVRVAMSQPIFFRAPNLLPAAMSYHVQRVTTPSGRDYTKLATQGITNSSWDATGRQLTLNLTNPVGSLVEMCARTGAFDPTALTVDGVPVPAAASQADFTAATGSSWWFDPSTRTMHLKALQSGGTGVAVVSFTQDADTTAPATPTNLRAHDTSPQCIHLSWDAVTGDMAGYTLYRNGAPLALVPAGTTSYHDTNLLAGTHYSYTVDAYDGAQNHSAQSLSAGGTTDRVLTSMFVPSADSYVTESNPNSNFGTASVLRIDGSPISRTYMRFDVQGLTAPVAKATLRMFATTNAGGGFDIHSADNTWSEGSIKFNNAPAFSTDVFGSSNGQSASTWSNTDVSSLITGNGTYTLAIDTPTTTSISYASRESASAPQLSIDTTVPTNDPPAVDDVTVSATQDTQASWTPDVNDPDEDPVTCWIVTQPSHGTATVAPDCSSGTYTPTAGYTGPDSFTYKATDSHGADSTVATANVSVTGTNRAPTASDRSLTTVQDTQGTWTPSVSDPNAGDTKTCSIVSQPAHGTATVSSDCSGGTYTPSSGYTGADSFTYKATDGGGADSNTATVSATVSPPNHAPTASDRSVSATAGAAAAWAPSVSDPDSGDTLTCSIVSQPSHGAATVTPDCSSASYTPDASYSGPDSFTYKATDNHGVASNTATVSATVVQPNHAPSATGGSVTTTAGVAASWTPSASDPDSGDTITCSIASSPAHGTATVSSDCSNGNYTPGPGYSGPDSFTYRATDNHGASSGPATISVTVNSPPTMTVTTTFNPAADSYVNSGSPTSNFGTLTALRIDGSPVLRSYLRFAVSGLSGTVQSATLKVLTNTSTAGHDVHSADNSWGETTINYNNAPAPSATTYGSAGTTAAGAWTSANVTSLVTGNGTYTMTLDAKNSTAVNYASRESSSQPQLVVTTLVPLNRAPSAGSASLTTLQDTAGSWTPSASDPDVGDSVTCSIVSQPSHGTATVAPDCSGGTYTPSSGYTGSDSFTYKATDNHGIDSAPATVSATVNAPNRAPTAADRTVSTTMGTQGSWTPSVSDADSGDTLSCTIVSQPSHGTATVAPDCSSGAYTPASGYSGSDSFTYKATDNHGADSNAATVNALVNNAPTASDRSLTTAQDTQGSWTPSVSDPNAGDTLSCSIVSQPAHGTATVAPDCSGGTYAPSSGYTGGDSFTYKATDNHGTDSNAATVTATVNAPNRAPTASDRSLTTLQDTQGSWTPSASDLDSGDTLSCSIVSQPAHGTATVASDCSGGTYTPSSGYTGGDSFTYKATDNHGADSNVATVNATVNAPNHAPAATNRSLSTITSTQAPWTPSVSDPDVGDTLSCAIASSPAHGTATVAPDCSSGTYMPSAGYTGPDSFTYTATDNHGAVSNAATVSASTDWPTLFSDNFESGNLSAWTSSKGLTVQSAAVENGSFAARGQATNGVTYAKKTLGATYTDVTYRLGFRMDSAPTTGSVTVMRFRTAGDAAIAGLYLTSSRKLGIRNDAAATSKNSTTATLNLGQWYTLEMHAIVNGTTSTLDVKLNGTKVGDISSSATNLGTTPIGMLQIGENASGSAYTYEWDDVIAQQTGGLSTGAALHRACAGSPTLSLSGAKHQKLGRKRRITVYAQSGAACAVTAVARSSARIGGRTVSSGTVKRFLRPGTRQRITLSIPRAGVARVARAARRRPVRFLVVVTADGAGGGRAVAKKYVWIRV